jgi:aryl-alcohol dehydrogenase-like predicted oxidoreductase
MFDTTLLDFVPFFKSKGVGIVDAAGMSMGILTPNGPQDWHPADPEIKEACVKARAYCKEKGVNIAALAAYFNMSREGPATHVISCADVPVLDKNIKTAREGISEGEKKVMNEVIEKFFKRLKINNWEGLENAGYWKAQKDSGKKPEDFEGIHIDPYWKIVNSIRK